MTAGLSHDMRRTALVSLVAHVVALVALTTVPLTKIHPRGASAIEVLLVSQPSAPVQVAQAPVPQPKPAPPPPPAPPKKLASTPPAVAKATPVPHTALLQKRLQEITVPKEVAPVLPMPKSSPQPVTASPSEPFSPKPRSSRDLAEAFKKAEDALAKPPVTKPLPPSQSPAPLPQTSEEIKKLLDTLPLPTPAMPGDATPTTKELAPAVARAPQGTATVARPPTVEHCPPKARAYCPLLEAAINRVWNADTNPAVRQVLDSAGDSTATMRIVIQPNGEIRDIVLYRSSGNDAYDRAVESVLRELQRVPPLPDEMKGESFVAVTSFTYTKQ